MEKNYNSYINQLNNYKPTQNSSGEDDWSGLEKILENIMQDNLGEKCLSSMFGVFERYSCEDNGILWSMLHGIESVLNYENELLKSIERQPSFFTTLMINRILNDNISHIGDKSLIDVLVKVQSNPKTPAYVKECAEQWIERHT